MDKLTVADVHAGTMTALIIEMPAIRKPDQDSWCPHCGWSAKCAQCVSQLDG